MVIKIYVSGISGNKEVKKRQQRVLLILDSKKLQYDVIDIAEPGAEEAKDFVQNNATANGGTISDPNPRHPLPPQIFNDDVYCGDYNMFDLANEEDRMEEFLKLEPTESSKIIITDQLKNGDISADEKVPETSQIDEPTTTTADETPESTTVPNEQEAENEISATPAEENVEPEETKKEEDNDDKVGDAAAENNKEEETVREPSPEKAEE